MDSFERNICIFALACNSRHDVLSTVCDMSVRWRASWNERKHEERKCVSNCQFHRRRVEFVLWIGFGL